MMLAVIFRTEYPNDSSCVSFPSRLVSAGVLLRLTRDKVLQLVAGVQVVGLSQNTDLNGASSPCS